jgi:hypothetical protein
MWQAEPEQKRRLTSNGPHGVTYISDGVALHKQCLRTSNPAHFKLVYHCALNGHGIPLQYLNRGYSERKSAYSDICSTSLGRRGRSESSQHLLFTIESLEAKPTNFTCS